MKTRNIIITLGFLTLFMLIGVSFSFFTYVQTSEENSQLLAGEIYMHFNETGDSISLTNAFPESDEDARARTGNTVTFTIDGVNTTTNKDIYYEIVLLDGEAQNNKTRLKDNHLKFDLVESKTVNNVTTTNTVLNGVGYNELNNTKIWVNTIPANTTSEIVYTYQLRMWISDKVVISDTTSSADYTLEEFANSYASVRVAVNGDFEEKKADDTIPPSLYEIVETNLASYLLPDDGDARILSGSSDDSNLKNYVWYSGKLWRIFALNNDGSVKLVTQDNITTIEWGADTTYEGSWMYQWLNEDFKDTLYNHENLLVTNYKWNATETTESTKPSNTTMVEGAVGLLNYYEYVQSYSKLGEEHNKGYLINHYRMWTITPVRNNYVWDISGAGGASNGAVGIDIPGSLATGVRPSINLIANIQISCTTCDGSETNPYMIIGDINLPSTNTLINERISGEYLTFDNELYRIVNIENGITKITKIDYIRDDNSEVVKKYLASTITYGASRNTQSDDYWDYYLNNTWYNSISANYKNMLASGTWYLGIVESPASYKNAICATNNTTETTKLCTKTGTIYNGYVGLGRIGEMFASQMPLDWTKVEHIWTITPISTGNSRYITTFGHTGYGVYKTLSLAARPSVFLNSTIKITGGLGTKESPFEISA